MEEKSNVSTMSDEVVQSRPNPKKPSTGSKFKGVLPQPNGNWGAQIYSKQQRIWLGTFQTEEEAAAAYDSAAVLFRSAESPRNLPCRYNPSEEQRFQSLYIPKVVLGMIKDGSYRSRFDEFLRVKFRSGPAGPVSPADNFHGFSCRQLFQKELTPSDVGKLNRLVIPKKYAMKYFPKITEPAKPEVGPAGGVDLFFYDQSMRSWWFRYCYWSSSQSFVFTKGWSLFVKEKALKSNDVVTFYICEHNGNAAGENRIFSMIGILRDDGENLNGYVGAGGGSEAHVVVGSEVGDRVGPAMEGDVDEKIGAGSNVPGNAVGFRLFGVQIN